MQNSVYAEKGPGRLSIWINRIPVVAALYAVTGGFLTLTGWAFGIDRLIDWYRTGITMKPNTAVCVILLGLALLLATKSRVYRVWIWLLAGLSIIVALLTLSQYIFNINLGIDTLLFNESPGSPATSAPGRMGPPAITSFALLGFALLLSTGSSAMRRAAGWLGVTVLALSMLPLLGYMYGASQLYSLAQLTGIAFQTAILIAVLSIGVINAVREFGLNTLITANTAGAVMFRRLAVPLVIVSISFGWLRVAGQNLGFYDTAFGTAARTVVEILVIIGLLWWTARGINRAEESLRDADRRKDEFIATLSHELRNPLAPIRNAAQILRHSSADSRDIEASRSMIERQVAHMARLIDDLLDVGRITQNKIDLRKETVDIQTAVRQAVETFGASFADRHQNLAVDMPARPIYLDADPVRLGQILGNLLNNASKFTEPGGAISITVAEDASNVTIKIRDNGVGIPSERLDNVFAMFAQIDARSGMDHSGLGIGLNLTKQLVELHGGSIEATSDGVGTGSTFVVVLPKLDMLPVESRPAKSESNGRSERKRRILVVEDNEDSRESLELMMKLAGNETAAAGDGVDALEKAREFRPEIILLDIGLPKLDGYEVCRQIRSEPWGDDVTVIALTGWGQDEDRQRTSDAGFDAHLIKPVDPVALLDMLAANAGSERGDAARYRTQEDGL